MFENEEIQEQPIQSVDKGVQNLKGAALNDTTPEQFDVQPVTQKIAQTSPKVATRVVANEMNESTAKSSAIAPDADNLSYAERFLKRTGLGNDMSDASRMRAQLANRIRENRQKGIEPSEDDLMILEGYRLDLDDLKKEEDKLNVDWVSKGVGDTYTSIRDYFKNIIEVPEPTIGGAAAGAAVGAATAWTVFGAPISFTSGLIAGTVGSNFIANKNRIAGEMYDDLSIAIDDKGRPLNIPENEKNALSDGVGYLSSAIESSTEVVLGAASKAIGKWVGKGTSAEISKAITSNPALRKSLLNLTKSAFKAGSLEATTEVIQNNIQDLGTHLGQSWDGSDTSLSRALDTFSANFSVVEQAETAVRAFVAGGTMTVADRGYAKIHDKAAKVLGKNKSNYMGEGTPPAPPSAPQTVETASAGTPSPNLIESEQAAPVQNIDGQFVNADGSFGSQQSPTTQSSMTELGLNPQGIIVDADGMPTYMNPQDAITLTQTLKHLGTVAGDSKISESPIDAIALQRKMLEDSGVNELWVTEKSLDKWANNEAKVKLASKIMFGKQSDLAVDAKILVNLDDYIEARNLDPEIDNVVSALPSNPTLSDVREALLARQQQAEQFLSEKGAAPATGAPVVQSTSPAIPLEPAPVDTTQLGINSTDEEIASTLRNQQEANAYLDRLNSEEQLLTSAPQPELVEGQEPVINERLTQVQAMRDRVNNLKATLPEQTITQMPRDGELTQLEEAEAMLSDYMSEPATTALVRQGMTKETQDVLTNDYARVRQSIAEGTKEAAFQEMQDNIDLITEIAKAEDNIELAKQIKDDVNVQKVESFLANRESMRINPDSLNEIQRRVYKEDPILTRRKVFKKDGITLNELAVKLGLPDGDAVLEVLSKVPDEKQAVKNAIEIREKELSDLAINAIDLNTAGIIIGIENKQRLRLKEIKAMFELSNAKTRTLIEGTVYSNINLENIKAETAEMISNVRISQLNPNNYFRSSKLAAKRAVKAALRGDLLEASRQREIEIRSDEMYKQSLIAKGKSNRIIKSMARRMRSEDINSRLTQAGNLKAFNSLNTMFNIDRKNIESVQALQSYMDKVESQQLTDNAGIPENLLVNYDPRADVKTLSLGQIETLHQLQSDIITDADLTIELQEQQADLVTETNQTLFGTLENNSNYDPSNSQIDSEDSDGFVNNVGDYLAGSQSYMENVQNFTLRLVENDRSNPIFNIINNQLEGIGDYDNGFGSKARDEKLLKAQRYILEKLDEAGSNRIMSYGNDWVTVPEFENSTGLLRADGKIRKLDLMMLLTYFGSFEGVDRIKNFTIDPNVLPNVFETHLIDADVDFIDAVYNVHEGMKPDITRTQKILKGEEVEFIKPRSYELFGKNRRGGYVKLEYRNEQTISERTKESNREIKELIGESKAIPLSNDGTAGFTREGFKKQRAEDVKKLLSLDFNAIVARSIGDIINDTTMHVPIDSIMRVLNNKDNATHVQNILGKKGYNALKANILSSAKNIFSENIKLVQDIDNQLTIGLSRLGNNTSKNLLVFSGSTFVTQTASLPFLLAYTDKSAAFRGTYGFVKLSVQPWMWNKAFQAAARINPSINNYINNVDDYSTGGISKSLPKNEHSNSIIRYGSRFGQTMDNLALGKALGTMDNLMKVAATIGIYNDYYNRGASDGHTKAEIRAMSEQERVNAARAYTQSKTQNILTAGSVSEKSLFQKSKSFADWARFFNDGRNIYNLIFSDAREILNAPSKAKKHLQAGNPIKAANTLIGAGGTIIGLHLTAAVAASILSMAQGRDAEGEELPSILTVDWLISTLETTWDHVSNPLTAPKTALNSLPIVRNFMFKLQTEGWADIMPMQIQALNNVAKALYTVTAKDYEDWEEADKKAIITGVSAFAPVPSSAVNKYIIDEDNTTISDVGTILIGVPYLLIKEIEKLINPQAVADPKRLQALQTALQDIDPNDAALISQIQSDERAAINDQDLWQLIFTESAGQPNAKNQKTSAAGLGQATSSTWNDIMDKYPGAGLTRSGRTTDPDQQVTFVKLLSKENSIALIRNGFSNDLHNIYLAHHFGISTSLEILRADPNSRLPDLSRERAANPWMNGGVSYINSGEPVRTVSDMHQAINDLLDVGMGKMLDYEEENGTYKTIR